MATTRELITLAAWHLLDDAELLARYRGGDIEGAPRLAGGAAAGRASRRLASGAVPPRLSRFRRTRRAGDDRGRVRGSTCACGRSTPTQRSSATDGTSDLPRTVRSPRSVPPAVMSFSETATTAAPADLWQSWKAKSSSAGCSPGSLVADGPPRVRWNRVSQGYDLGQVPDPAGPLTAPRRAGGGPGRRTPSRTDRRAAAATASRGARVTFHDQVIAVPAAVRREGPATRRPRRSTPSSARGSRPAGS